MARTVRSTLTPTSAAGKLFLASFLSLFLELALIRWIPGTVHIVGFFTNLVLIGSFLGLGIGMARPAPEGDAAWRTFFRLAVVVGVLGLIHVLNPEVALPQGGDYGLNEALLDVGISIPLPFVLIAVFGMVAWSMIPLGQLVASPFDKLERIQAYSINIGGSLAGVVAFSILAWAQLPPEVWFAVGLGILFLIDRRVGNLVPALVVVAVLFALLVSDTNRFANDVKWSPYYKVITRPVVEGGTLDQGFVIDVNDQFLLSGLDLRPEASLDMRAPLNVAADVEMLKSYYSLPFQLRPVKRVLVLGAGAGNDVAAALRNGVEHVTAVEIDPLVLSLGKAHHPERPYSSPKVETVLNDARAYLNRTDEKFDLIIFATLDAHGLLSGAANVRLDSFVYTRESLESAKEHLTDDGLLVLSFGPFRDDIQLRQYAMVRSLFEQDPIYLKHTNRHRTIVAGDIDALSPAELPSEWRRITDDEIARDLERFPYALRPATDDWPHLYIRDKHVPTEYLGVFAGILLLSLLLVRRSFRGTRRLDGQFFFLGAGFLLMETKSVTEYALLVGSTWQTNSLVFTVILTTILVANLLVLTRVRKPPIGALYGLVIATLAMTYLWPISRWGLAPGIGAYAAAAVYLGVPIFLAAVIFATAFRNVRLGSEALASNLLGAVLGGVLEYLSLALGIRALSLLAATMYLAAFAFWVRPRRPSTPGRARSVVRSAAHPGGSVARATPTRHAGAVRIRRR
ncbi:MAG: methyltransferase domain-containing protein [Actinomycetota bacterium]